MGARVGDRQYTRALEADALTQSQGDNGYFFFNDER
jgi:hypothetical protein